MEPDRDPTEEPDGLASVESHRCAKNAQGWSTRTRLSNLQSGAVPDMIREP